MNSRDPLHAIVLFFFFTSTMLAPPKQNPYNHSIFPSALIPRPTIPGPSSIEPPRRNASPQNESVPTDAFFRLFAASAENVLHEQQAIRAEQQSLRTEQQALLRELKEEQLLFRDLLREEQTRREDGDRTTHELYLREVDRLQKQLDHIEEQLSNNKYDIDHYTGKKFLNLFAALTTIVVEMFPQADIKTLVHRCIIWNDETVSSSMLAYLFLVTTIIPAFFSERFQHTVIYKWFALYALFALPFWAPVKLLTQFNVLYRCFWIGFEGFDQIIAPLSTYRYYEKLSAHKRIIALSLLLCLIVISSIQFRKKYKKIRESMFLTKLFSLINHFFQARGILLEPQLEENKLWEELEDEITPYDEEVDEYEVA